MAGRFTPSIWESESDLLAVNQDDANAIPWPDASNWCSVEIESSQPFRFENRGRFACLLSLQKILIPFPETADCES